MASPQLSATQAGENTPRTGKSLAELLSLVEHQSQINELRARLFPNATRFFGAARGALFLLSEVPDDPRFQQNPVIGALLERHAPLHEKQIVSEREWQTLCLRADHGHVLVGPIVVRGELVGALGFTRHSANAPFDERNVSDLSALCLHVSTSLKTETAPEFDLSPREREIANLVAQGKTNAQIGRELFVSGETVKAALKTMFRKTNVSSRAQLVAVLAETKGS